MSLSTGRYQLYSALETLRLHWDDVRPRWSDAVRQVFEEQYWSEIEPRVNGALAAMDRLGQVLGQLRRECS
jgi:hypothetical protein